MNSGSNKKVFTTGDIARICQVAPRTVSKWFDSGRLRGYRIPGSQDRRIPRANLIRFLKDNGLPTAELESQTTVLAVSVADALADQLAGLLEEFEEFKLVRCGDGFEVGVASQEVFGSAVVDFSLGRGQALALAARLRANAPEAVLVALLNEDDADAEAARAAGYDVVYRKPVAASIITSQLASVVDGGRAKFKANGTVA